MKYVVLLIVFSLLACNKDAIKNDKGTPIPGPVEVKPSDKSAPHIEDAEHAHDAPNGGVLVGLEGHLASIEWLLEDDSIKLFIYDGCAENAIRVAHKELTAWVKVQEKMEKITLTAVASALTGDTVGASSSFKANELPESWSIPGDIHEIILESIDIQSVTYKDIKIEIKK